LCPSEGNQHGVSILSSANFSRTFRQITQQPNTVQISDLVKLFSCVSFIALQILGFFHQLVLILIFYGVIVKTKNNQEVDNEERDDFVSVDVLLESRNPT